MRIGIQASPRPAEDGGGFTYEDELFSGLIHNLNSSKHTFFVFSQKLPPANMKEYKNLYWVQVRWVFLKHLFASFRKFVNRILNTVFHLPSIFNNEHWIDEYLLRHRIEFYVNLSPETATSRVPYLVIVWDLLHREYPYFPEIHVGGRWARWEAKFSDLLRRAAIVCVSSYTLKSDITKYYQVSEELIRLLPFSTPQFALIAGKNATCNSDQPRGGVRPYLFYPANFHAHKNHVTVLQALQLLRDKHGLVFDLWLSGWDTGNLQYVQSIVERYGLQDQVYFLGYVPRESLVQAYLGAFALVFASLLGPTNLPPLEAFALGCPVIASNIPGAKEQFDEAALFFPPLDAGVLSEMILRLRDEVGLREEMVRRGDVRARQFTNDNIAQSIFAFLDEFEPIRRCWGNDNKYRKRLNLRRLFGL